MDNQLIQFRHFDKQSKIYIFATLLDLLLNLNNPKLYN